MMAAPARATDADERAALDRDGWTILRGALDRRLIERLAADLEPQIEATPFSEGAFYGNRTRRFGRLLSRSPLAAALVLHPAALGCAREVIGRSGAETGLNLTQLIAVSPGAPAQVPHRDDEMWPIPQPTGEYLVNVIWPLTSFRPDNGATRVWTGSHRGGVPTGAGSPDVASMQPGDALVVLGSTLHAQGSNISEDVRTGIVVGYRASWLLPGENPWLSHGADEARSWPAELADLVGYRRVAPNLNGVDCRCPGELLRGETAGGALDALRPGQEERIALYRLHERGAGG